MKTLSAILVFFLFVTSVSAGFSSDTSIYASGGIHHNTDHQTEDGTNPAVLFGPSAGIYHQVSAGQGIVTGMGNFSQLDVTTTIDSSFTSNSELSYSSGGTYYDTLSYQSVQPNQSEIACTAGQLSISGDGVATGATPNQQWADGQISGMGPNARMTSDKSADSEGYALSGAMEGRGLWQKDFSAGAESGFKKDKDTLNYRESSHEHDFASSGILGGISARTDLTNYDFSDPYTLTQTTTTINQTAADEPVINLTGEEA